MGKILQEAQAGTLESNDVIITVAPGEKGKGIVMDLQSIVLDQYGEAIRTTVANVLQEQSIEEAVIKIVDRGALDYILRARILTALSRGGVSIKGGVA